MQIEIRAARPDDADALASLNEIVQAVHTAAEPWLFKPCGFGPGKFLRVLERPENHVFVATVEREPIGYLYAELRHIPETSLTYSYQTLHVHHISVRETHRKSGVGRLLFERLRERGKELDVERFTADVWSFNESAQRFFADCGLSSYKQNFWTPL